MRKQRSDFKGNIRIHIRLPLEQVEWLNAQGFHKRSETIENLIDIQMRKEKRVDDCIGKV